jgi:hypothetical protein
MSIISKIFTAGAYYGGTKNKANFIPEGALVIGSMQLVRMGANALIGMNSHQNAVLQLKHNYNITDTMERYDRIDSMQSKFTKDELESIKIYRQEKKQINDDYVCSYFPLCGVKNMVENFIFPGIAFIAGVGVNYIAGDQYTKPVNVAAAAIALLGYDLVSSTLQNGISDTISLVKDYGGQALTCAGDNMLYLGQQINIVETNI